MLFIMVVNEMNRDKSSNVSNNQMQSAESCEEEKNTSEKNVCFSPVKSIDSSMPFATVKSPLKSIHKNSQKSTPVKFIPFKSTSARKISSMSKNVLNAIDNNSGLNIDSPLVNLRSEVAVDVIMNSPSCPNIATSNNVRSLECFASKQGSFADTPIEKSSKVDEKLENIDQKVLLTNNTDSPCHVSDAITPSANVDETKNENFQCADASTNNTHPISVNENQESDDSDKPTIEDQGHEVTNMNLVGMYYCNYIDFVRKRFESQ